MAAMEAAARTPGYHRHKQPLLQRLRRIEGQVRGVERMVEEDRHCIEVLTQIAAIQGALRQVAVALVEDHLRGCLGAGSPAVAPDRVTELVTTIERLV